MKVTNWRKKLAAAIVAAGITVPGVANAGVITVPDADFQTYTITRAQNYAYAHSAGVYRPTSPWVDDYGHTGQDTGGGNWLINFAYGTVTNKIYPVTQGGAGDQAMEGRPGSGQSYSGQTLTDTFAADTTYTFSVIAQGVFGTNYASRTVALYLFNGDDLTTFTDANALLAHTFTANVDFNQRADNSAAGNAGSQANWRPLTWQATVPSGSPLVGQHIGIGFRETSGTAVDNVSLTSEAAVPEPTTMMLLGLGGVALIGCRRRD